MDLSTYPLTLLTLRKFSLLFFYYTHSYPSNS